jgi:hypothetical protein
MITLQQNEREALRELARRERRDPRAQAAFLLREKLIEHGYLSADATPASTVPLTAQQVKHTG